MNTIIVGLMTLMPAIVSLVFVIGVPVVLAAWLLPENRSRTGRVSSSPGRPGPAGYIRDIYHRTGYPKGIGGRRKAFPA